MRLRLRHTLRLRFPEPARNVIAILKLTPRSHEGQRVANWRIDVEPDCLLKAGEDHYGNLVHTLTVSGVAAELTIMARGELTSFDALGVVRGSAERLPADIYRRDTALTGSNDALRGLAERARAAADNDLGRLHALMDAAHDAVAYAPDQDVTRTAAAALEESSGGARDHAQILIACARHLAIPARCARGFLLDEGGGATRHTWAELFVAGLGWVGFDSALNICPQDEHVRVSVGLDGFDVSPLRGANGAVPDETVEATWLLGRETRPA